MALRTRCTIQSCTCVSGNTLSMASGNPLSPSTQAIRMSFTPRVYSAVRMASQNLASSCSIAQLPWYSFNLILPCSAGREAVERKARRAGNGAPLPSGATPRATASRPARREPHSSANTALQPLTRARHSLRTAPCLDAAVWL